MNRSGILEEVKKILKIWQLELNLEYENPEKMLMFLLVI
jgi:hypothetical protein